MTRNLFDPPPAMRGAFGSVLEHICFQIVAGQLGHKALGWMKPIAHIGRPSGFYVNVSIIAQSLLGPVLSLRGKGYHRVPEPLA